MRQIYGHYIVQEESSKIFVATLLHPTAQLIALHYDSVCEISNLR